MELPANRTTDPDGRTVVFDAGSHLHLARRRPWLLEHIDVILEAVARPDHREDDPRPGRERFYRQHIDLRRWLRVVVDFNETPAWIVTAAVQDNDPRRRSSR
ncbi:MAG: hypothetical protein ACRDK9_13085 [Solirubrobacterales bacterium]